MPSESSVEARFNGCGIGLRAKGEHLTVNRILAIASIVTIAASSASLVLATPRCEGRLLLTQIDARQEQTLTLLRAKAFDQLQRHMDAFLDAYVAGTLSDEELFFEFGAFDRWSPALTPLFQEWLTLYPRSYAAYHAMALHTASVAWQARGGKLASETSAQQMSEFTRRLRDARDWSLRSIALHSKPILAYQQLMTNAKAIPFDTRLPNSDGKGPLPKLDLFEPTPRPDVLPILRESIRLQPDNTIVRVAYVTVLAPRWGGGLGALLDYSRPRAHVGLPPDRVAAVTYEATMEIANDFRFRKRFDDAVVMYEAASRICRLNPPLVEIGNVRLKQERYAEALSAADAAVSVVPGSRSGLRIRALALHGLSRQEEAATLLQRLAPEGWPDVLYLLGDYYTKGAGGLNKDPGEARRLFGIAARGGDERAMKQLQAMDATR